MKGRIYAIDPGLGGTGWAEWTADTPAPSRVGVLTEKRQVGRTLADRCKSLSDDMRRIIRQGGDFDDSVKIYIEIPQHMTSAKGLAAQGGAIYKLCFLVGYFACRLWPCRVFEITPGAWKGQLPKDVVIGRIQREIGGAQCVRLGITTHAWDAVGIGLWAMGRIKIEERS